MGRGTKIILLNDKIPEIDREANGSFYERETLSTCSIYRAFNTNTGKSYIGRASSYTTHGKKGPIYYGAKGRFKRHLSNSKSENLTTANECPIFYEALRNSNIQDWFIFTIKICSDDNMRDYENQYIKKYQTSNPNYGYNYHVGDKQPDNSEHLEKYKISKANGNVERATNGKLKRTEQGKNLPPNINYRSKTKQDGTISEGYFVQIKINGKLYNKAFLSSNESMSAKLDKAIKQLELFKKQAQKEKINKKYYSGSKTNKK